MDVRLRWPPRPNGGWLFAAGAGWAASRKDVPYLTGSVGIRGGAGVRWGAELEARAYRIPWTSETAEYVDGEMVRLISARSYESWATSLGVRLVLELPMSRR